MAYKVFRFSLVASVLVAVGFAAAVHAECFGLKSCGSDLGCGAVAGDPSLAPTTLFSLSDDGLIFNEIGVVTVSGIPIDADALALSADQRLFAFELLNSSAGPPSGSRLIEIDPATAVATPVGPELLGRELRGAVFDRSGRLKVYDLLASELMEIDADNGLQVVGAAWPLTLGGLPHTGTARSDLAVRTDGQMFYIEEREVYALDANDGALTLLWSDQVPAIDGLTNLYIGATFSPAAVLDLFAFDGRGTEDIFVFETAVGYARQQLHTAIIPAYNAGSGDLGSALPTCASPPGEVWGLQLGTASGGTELVLSWDDDPTAAEYVVFNDVSTDGQFANPVGLAVSGLTGYQLPMPSGNTFFLVAGKSGPCIGVR